MNNIISTRVFYYYSLNNKFITLRYTNFQFQNSTKLLLLVLKNLLALIGLFVIVMDLETLPTVDTKNWYGGKEAHE